MARARAEETKARILEAATRLFAARGRGSTSVRDIASAADVNPALVSHHFGGKDKLYAACVESMYGEIDALRDELVRSLGGEGTLAKTISAAVARGFHYARERRHAVKLVMRHVVDTGEVPQKQRDTLLLPFLDTASEALSLQLDRTPAEIRLIIQSVLFLMTRYALTSIDELALVAGVSSRQPEALILRHVEEHLARQARWLLGLSD